MSTSPILASAARPRLAHKDWEATLLPELGGAIGVLRLHGRDVLRPTPDGARDPLQAACFPLVPYANRIALGRFHFAGTDHRLPLNFGDHPHCLHGNGWQSPWRVASLEGDSAILALDHEAGPAWPWSYGAEQRLTLDDDGLQAELVLTNHSHEAMPAGLGFHPYFPKTESTRLRFASERLWLSDDTQLPTEAVAPGTLGNWATGAATMLPDLVDHAYEGWDGEAAILDPDRIIRVTAKGARAVHVYIPPAADFLCVEPVSHVPDAVNRPDFPIDRLDPGETVRLTMRIGCDLI